MFTSSQQTYPEGLLARDSIAGGPDFYLPETATRGAAPALFAFSTPVPAGPVEQAPLSVGGMASEEISEQPLDVEAHATPPAETPLDDLADLARTRPDGSEGHLTESQLQEAHRRRTVLTAAVVLLDQGAAYEQAARHAGVSAATLCRLLKLADGKVPRTATAADRAWALIEAPVSDLAPGRSEGRRSDGEDLLMLESFRSKLLTLYIATIGTSSDYRAGADRRSASVATALERMGSEPECPPDLAAKLRRGAKPAALVRFLRQQATPEMEARIRGVKKYQLHGIVSRRDHTARLPDGSRAALPAGYVVELDDMSSNQPFYVPGPEGSWVVSRQGLYARDLVSGRWLGVELVARPREAYRAEDILRFLRRLMQAYGKFPVIRVEQGVWAARSLKGFDARGSEEEVARPGMAQAERALLQEGLQALGVRVEYEHSARGKGSLESSFNHLQRVLATYTTEYVNLGRHAGEFDAGAKALRRARAESHTPEQLGFAPQHALADAIERAMTWCNARIAGRERSADDHWSADLIRRPLTELTPRDMAAFLPETRELTVRGLRVTATIDGKPHDFRSEILAQLGDGYRVFLRLDPTEPTLGAALYNRETSSANHAGYALGEFIGWAGWEMPGPQFDATAAEVSGLERHTTEQLYGVGREADAGWSARKAQDRWVRTAFRALPRPGQPALRAATARDGRGNVIEATNGAQPAGGRPAAEAGPEIRATPAEAAPRRRGGAFSLPTPEEYQAAKSRRDRLAAARARVAEMAGT